MKILALQFRYLGDAVLMTPALRAIHEHFDGAELHVVVPGEVVPVLKHIPWVERVWASPRRPGFDAVLEALPLLRDLRRQRYDRSVDFGGNDRGAIVSLVTGAPVRLGPLWPGGFLGRRFCYTQTVPASYGEHEIRLDLRIAAAWGIEVPAAPRLEIHADPALADLAERILPRPAILCHLSTSQPKKEWPISHWAELAQLARAAGYDLVFSSGVSAREAKRIDELKALVPEAAVLPQQSDLAVFLAVLKRARLVLGGDSGPIHFAAALGVPTIGLFGPSAATRWAPLGEGHRALQVPGCDCRREDTAVCSRPQSCLRELSARDVLRRVQTLDAAIRTPRQEDTRATAAGHR